MNAAHGAYAPTMITALHSVGACSTSASPFSIADVFRWYRPCAIALTSSRPWRFSAAMNSSSRATIVKGLRHPQWFLDFERTIKFLESLVDKARSGEYKLGFYLNGLPVAGSPIALVAHAFHQRAGAAIDEALHQPFMQGVGQGVLDLACAAAPVIGVVCPVGAVCGIGPGAHIGEPRGQRIDIAGRLALERAERDLGDTHNDAPPPPSRKRCRRSLPSTPR